MALRELKVLRLERDPGEEMAKGKVLLLRVGGGNAEYPRTDELGRPERPERPGGNPDNTEKGGLSCFPAMSDIASPAPFDENIEEMALAER